MPRAPLGVEKFRAAYGAVIEELLRFFDTDPESRRMLERALMRSPLQLPRGLRSVPASLQKRFAKLRDDAKVATNRDELEAAAGAVIRDMLQVHEQAAGEAHPPGWARAKPPMRGNGGGEGGGRTLGVSRSARPSPPAAAPPANQPSPPQTRYMNAAIADHPAGRPLAMEKDYLLEVWVGLEEQGDAAAVFPSANLTHRPDEDVIELTIQVTSDDFTIAQDAVPLKLPRVGPSRGKARFDVSAKRAGRGTFTIVVHKDGNLVLQMKVSYSVGDVPAEPVSVQVAGRPLAAATQLRERKLSLLIEPGTNGYSCVASGATATRLKLPITEVELGDIVSAARDAMLSVVNLLDDDSRKAIFQDGIEIDAAAQEKALRILANAGATLFQRLFFGPSAGAEVQRVGTLLRELATRPDKSYTFQFNVDRFPVPWGLLYFGKAGDDDALDWDLFLGMRHVVEQIPFQAGSLVVDTEIPSGPALAVSVNFNTSIDKQYDLDVVARQRSFWHELVEKAGGHMTLAEGLTRKDILGSFRRPSPDQLTYLYCHAETAEPGAPGGINASSFVFASDERLTLEEMNRNAPTTEVFPGKPLVFINACESAELRPEFYDGFIPYFMAKGARGVVGTECETPAIFATEWALRFFPRFLDGAPLGEVFLDLRREFREQHGNPLGLLYNVYCNADTQVQPGLTL